MIRRRDLLSGAAAGSVMALGGRLAFADPVTITFLHCNDVYEIGPKPGKGGGFAPFMSLLEVERRRAANSITTFGGDLISPSLLSGLTKGQQMIELTNAIGIEVAVLGNHEFDFGPEIAKERIGESHYPWLGTNVLGKDGQPAVGTHDLKLMTVAGYKIGFFGVLTPETAQLSSPGPDITFANPFETATKAVADLKGMGADMIVAMTHLDIADDRALAAKVKGIDLILGGHDHEPITFDEGSTLIIKAGYDLHYLAVVDVTIERVKQKGKEVVAWRPAWRYVPTEDIKPQPQIQAIVARWEKKLDEDLGQPVGVTSVELDTRRSSVRTEETNFGDLVADAIRLATNSDIAITNGGGIRGDRTYSPGTQITRKDIMTELPFGNVTVVTDLKGSDVRAALENGVSQIEDTAGRFPQVSGLSFTWDPSKPPGSRIVAVEVGGKPLDPTKIYRVATNDYMLSGGDGYTALGKGKVVIDPSGATLMATTVMNYITAKGGKIDPKTDGRITRVD